MKKPGRGGVDFSLGTRRLLLLDCYCLLARLDWIQPHTTTNSFESHVVCSTGSPASAERRVAKVRVSSILLPRGIWRRWSEHPSSAKNGPRPCYVFAPCNNLFVKYCAGVFLAPGRSPFPPAFWVCDPLLDAVWLWASFFATERGLLVAASIASYNFTCFFSFWFCVLYPTICALSTSRRGMAGGYPADMAVKKNYVLEEWNGKREITERSFKMTSELLPTFIVYVLVIPYGIYTWTRSEMLSRGDRRYKEVF